MEDREIRNLITNLQGICEKLFEKYGSTDEVLELQTLINQLRHKHDIPDASKKLYEDYVQ